MADYILTDENFYPRPPRGGRRITAVCIKSLCYFYPRPPRGGRHRGKKGVNIVFEFLSTPSARRATKRRFTYSHRLGISIHALREEGDESKTSSVSGPWIFLSTPSARRATWRLFGSQRKHPISIHALREEGDLEEQVENNSTDVFLSTPSARRATQEQKA